MSMPSKMIHTTNAIERAYIVIAIDKTVKRRNKESTTEQSVRMFFFGDFGESGIKKELEHIRQTHDILFVLKDVRYEQLFTEQEVKDILDGKEQRIPADDAGHTD